MSHRKSPFWWDFKTGGERKEGGKKSRSMSTMYICYLLYRYGVIERRQNYWMLTISWILANVQTFHVHITSGEIQNMLGEADMSSSIWYRLIINTVLIIKTKMQISFIRVLSVITCYIQLNGFICHFVKVSVFIQMIRTLLFINQFLQVWYQNEEDTHLLLDIFLLCSM